MVRFNSSIGLMVAHTPFQATCRNDDGNLSTKLIVLIFKFYVDFYDK